jgi:hypothetical protein
VPKIRPVSATQSLTDANPAALAASEEQQENTDPMHEKEQPLSEMRSKKPDNSDPVEEVMDPNTEHTTNVQSMPYDPYDQDNTTWD